MFANQIVLASLFSEDQAVYTDKKHNLAKFK